MPVGVLDEPVTATTTVRVSELVIEVAEGVSVMVGVAPFVPVPQYATSSLTSTLPMPVARSKPVPVL